MAFLYQNQIATADNGIATVWLLATLGKRFGNSKVSKREIQKLSIPKVCTEITNQTLITEEYPLRQASSLLYGVTLVYKQQTEYNYKEVVLAKQSIIRDFMKLSGNPKKLLLNDINNTIDSNGQVGSAKVVLLRDDPDFNVQIDLVPDLEEWQMGTQRRKEIEQQKQQQQIPYEDSFNLELIQDDELRSDGIRLSQEIRKERDDLEIIMGSEADFVFGNDGNVIEINNSYKNQENHNHLEAYDDYGYDAGFIEPDPIRLDGGLPDQQLTNEGLNDFDLNFEEINVPPIVSASSHPEQEQISKTPKKARKTNKRTKLKVDSSIAINLNQLREWNQNYVDTRLNEIQKLQVKSIEQITPISNFENSIMNLPDFTKSAVETLIKTNPSINDTTIDAVTRGRKRARSRSSSVSSIELGRRDGEASRSRNSLSRTEDFPQYDDFGYENNWDYNNDLFLTGNEEADNAIIDISFQGNSEFDDFGVYSKEPHLSLQRGATGNSSSGGIDDVELKTFYDELMEKKADEFVGTVIDKEQDIKEIGFDDILGASCSRAAVATCFHKLLHLTTKNLIGLEANVQKCERKTKYSLLEVKNVLVLC